MQDVPQRVDHGIVPDRPRFLGRERDPAAARMPPVGMVVDIVQPGLNIRGAVAELRSGNRLFGLQFPFHVVRHARPIAGFGVEQEADEIPPRWSRIDALADLDRRHGMLGEALHRVTRNLRAALDRKVVQFVPSDLEPRQLQMRLGRVLGRLKDAGHRLPGIPDAHEVLQAERAPAVLRRGGRHTELPRLGPFRAANPERQRIELPLFHGQFADHLGVKLTAILRHLDPQHTAFRPGIARPRTFFKLPRLPVERDRRFERAVSDLFVMQRLSLPFPCVLQGRCVGIRGVQPDVPLTAEFRRVGFRQAVESSVIVMARQRIFVADFDHRHTRLVGVGVAGVGIDVRQQLLCVLLLQLDHPRHKLADSLVRPGQLFRVLEAVTLVQRPSDVQVDVHVEASFLERRDHVVEFFQLVGIEVPLGQRVVGQNGLRRFRHEVHVPRIHEVQPYAIDAESRQTRRQLVRRLVRRKVRGAGKIGRVETDGARVGDEMTVLHSHEAVLAGRRIEQVGDA